MRVRLTRKQKFIASCCNPLYGGLSTRKEVKKIKLLARGHYWDEADVGNYEYHEGLNRHWWSEADPRYCSFSPTGKRRHFECDYFSWGTKRQKARWKKEGKLAARLWAQGKVKQSEAVEHESWVLRDKRGDWVIQCK